jgi:SH3-like domain-containing protein
MMMGRLRVTGRLLAAVLLPAVLLLSPAPANAESWRVTNDDPTWRLHLRSGPSSRSRVVGYIPGNTGGLESRQCSGNWCEIEFRGLVGWAYKGYLEPDDSARGFAATDQADIAALEKLKTIRLVNPEGILIPIHTFPDEKLPVAGFIAADTKQVEGLGSCVSAWCYVRSGDLIGWLELVYFAPDQFPDAPDAEGQPAAPEPPASEPPLEPGQTDRTLNETATTATTFTAIEDTAPETATDPFGDLPPPPADPASEDELTFRVSGRDLWTPLEIFARPAEDAKILGTIPSYASGIVPIGACNLSWCNIRFINITGWVRTKYLVAQRS